MLTNGLRRQEPLDGLEDDRARHGEGRDAQLPRGVGGGRRGLPQQQEERLDVEPEEGQGQESKEPQDRAALRQQPHLRVPPGAHGLRRQRVHRGHEAEDDRQRAERAGEVAEAEACQRQRAEPGADAHRGDGTLHDTAPAFRTPALSERTIMHVQRAAGSRQRGRPGQGQGQRAQQWRRRTCISEKNCMITAGPAMRTNCVASEHALTPPSSGRCPAAIAPPRGPRTRALAGSTLPQQPQRRPDGQRCAPRSG